MSRPRILNDEQVLAIRWAPDGWCGCFALAFSVSRVAVWKARRGLTHKHLQVRS